MLKLKNLTEAVNKKYLKEENSEYTLKNGQFLRDSIKSDSYVWTISALWACYEELMNFGFISKSDYKKYTEDYDTYVRIGQPNRDDRFWIDGDLEHFYDLCNELKVKVSKAFLWQNPPW